MKVGSVEIYANHPVVVIGSSTTVDYRLNLGGSAAVASDSHVLVATRGQAALVRVALWQGTAPRSGRVVFDGELTIIDQFVDICDIEGVSRFRMALGIPGRRRLLVSVDDPGIASRVDVVFEPGGHVRELTAAEGLPLFAIATPEEGIAVTDELSVILSERDSPLARLAAAVTLISGSPAERPAIESFWIRMVVEWLRWSSPRPSLEESRALGRYVESCLPALRAANNGPETVRIAEEVLRRATRRSIVPLTPLQDCRDG